MLNTLEGPLRMVHMIFTSLVLIFHANEFCYTDSFSDFDKTYVYTCFYTSYVVLDQFKGKNGIDR